MSAIGTKRTMQPRQRLSAFGSKRTKLEFPADPRELAGQGKNAVLLVPLRHKMPPAQGGQIGVSFVLDSLGQLRLFPTYRFVGYQ